MAFRVVVVVVVVFEGAHCIAMVSDGVHRADQQEKKKKGKAQHIIHTET